MRCIISPKNDHIMKAKLILMMMLLSLAVLGQKADRNISGTVRDANDKAAIAGASVRIEGASKGAFTDANGHYSIKVPDGKTKLVFAFVGYETQTVTIGKSDTQDVLLKVSSKELTEVVVQSYGTQRKAALTGAVSTVKAKDLQELQSTSVDQALQGRLPGVVVRTDQMEYRASSYPVKANATAEEMLKKLPGVQVGANGSATRQGQTVAKAKLNGKAYYAPAPQPTNESYNTIVENAFLDPMSTPLSTFAVDVDSASYSNFRRLLNNGQFTTKSQVR